jgi:ATPase subunit of ABC transporter with duplicated ATPase domains
VIVSHDREFLARTVTRIVELDLAQQQVGVYDGGYDSYLAERAVARRHAREAYEEYDDRLGGLKDRARCSATGWPRASATPAARPPTTTRSAARRAPRPARSRPRRPARPSG